MAFRGHPVATRGYFTGPIGIATRGYLLPFTAKETSRSGGSANTWLSRDKTEHNHFNRLMREDEEVLSVLMAFVEIYSEQL